MNAKSIIGVVAVVAIVALTIVLWPRGGQPPREQAAADKAGVSGEAAPTDAYVDVGCSVTGEDVDRLAEESQKIKGLIEISGRGARAENGFEVGCDFYYVTEVAYDSLVKERSVTPAGEVRVVEMRRYDQCSDQITFGDFDMTLRLDTLPIQQVKPYVAAVAEFFCAGASAMVEGGVELLYETLDGASARKTLGVLSGILGEDAPKEASEWIERTAKPEAEHAVAEVKRAVQEISGKEYLVTYYQSQTGEPLRFKFERADGTPLTLSEQKILREMNVFLSCNVVPSGAPAIGESWNIQVGDLPCAFDSLSGGNKISGELKATRLPDAPDGSWKVDIGGGRVAVINENGMEDGSFMVRNGCALADPSGGQLRALEIVGVGKLRIAEAKKRLIVLDFLTRTEGDCEVRMTLAAEGAK